VKSDQYRPFGLRYGFLVPPCITFTEASVFIPDGRIARVRLATIAFLNRSSRYSGGSSASSHTPLTESVCPPSRHLIELWRGNWALCPCRESYRYPPCAESPFASPRFYSSRVAFRHLTGSYSCFLATTDSCVRPSLSHALRFPSFGGSLQVAASPC
jgi:hypothetical protein